MSQHFRYVGHSTDLDTRDLTQTKQTLPSSLQEFTYTLNATLAANSHTLTPYFGSDATSYSRRIYSGKNYSNYNRDGGGSGSRELWSDDALSGLSLTLYSNFSVGIRFPRSCYLLLLPLVTCPGSLG